MSIMTTIVLPSFGIRSDVIMTTIVLPLLGIRSDVYNDNNCITFIRNSFTNL